jgi:histidinol dehydrogenase
MTRLERLDPAAFTARTAPLRRFAEPRLDGEAQTRLHQAMGREIGAEEAVREIVADVRSRGDAAVREWTRRLDDVDVPRTAVPAGALRAAWEAMPVARREAWTTASERIRAFHERQREALRPLGDPGLMLRPQPLRRAACYVPGGRAAYPSTVLMTAIPALVAGVDEVVLASPPGSDGLPHPEVLAAAWLAGAHEVHAMGGAQAVAALAHGTQTVRAVDVLVGPGNIFVTLAKRCVYGSVGLDFLAGPSEIMVVATQGAEAALVAADLVSQLEHDPLAWAVLVTDDVDVAAAVEAQFERAAAAAERRGIVARSAERHGFSVLCPDLETALRVCDDFAPEHLELVGPAAESLADRVRTAGAVFVGADSPVAMGDYIAGPNHTLPTGGAARFSGPLSVFHFVRWSSLTRLRRDEMVELGPVAQVLSEAEGLHGHTASIELRLQRLRDGAGIGGPRGGD